LWEEKKQNLQNEIGHLQKARENFGIEPSSMQDDAWTQQGIKQAKDISIVQHQ